MRIRLRLLACSLAVVGAASCSRAAPEEVESETVVPVTTEPATTGNIRAVIHTTGVVTAAPGAEMLVIAPEPARIVEMPKAEGDRVRRGDLLVRFEIPTTNAEVARQGAEVQRAQAGLENARAAQARAHELFDKGVGARRDMEDADRAVADTEAAVAQAQAGRTAANAMAARATAVAAFDGIVAKRLHNPGDLVEAAASDPVMRIIDPRRLEVTAAVPIADVSRVSLGAAARISGAPGVADIPLKVTSLPVAVEPGTAAVPVRLALPASATLPVGAPVQVDLDAEEHANVVMVPSSAIVREGEETAVFVAADDKAERRPVVIGLADAEHVEVRSGIKAGEQVITGGHAGLPDGAAISVGTTEPPTEEPAEK